MQGFVVSFGMMVGYCCQINVGRLWSMSVTVAITQTCKILKKGMLAKSLVLFWNGIFV